MRIVLSLSLLLFGNLAASIDDLSLQEQQTVLKKGLEELGYFKYLKLNRSYVELNSEIVSLKLKHLQSQQKLNNALDLNKANTKNLKAEMQKLVLENPDKAKKWEAKALVQMQKGQNLVAKLTKEETDLEALLNRYQKLLTKVEVAEKKEREKLAVNKERLDRFLKKWTEVTTKLKAEKAIKK